jgi:hypothetical protein
MPARSTTERKRVSSGIEIDENLRFQRRMWRIERIGWWGIAAILVSAVVGLFGHGPASRATLEVTDPIEPAGRMLLDYERFGRAFSESRFVFTRPAGLTDGKSFTLWLSGDYLNHVEVLRITPDPAGQELVSNGVRYHFPVHDGPQHVTFRFKAQRPGALTGTFRLNDGPPATFRQWLFP